MEVTVHVENFWDDDSVHSELRRIVSAKAAEVAGSLPSDLESIVSSRVESAISDIRSEFEQMKVFAKCADAKINSHLSEVRNAIL